MTRFTDECEDGLDDPGFARAMTRRRGRPTEPHVFAIPSRQFDTDPTERTVIAGNASAADVTQEMRLTSADLADLYWSEMSGLTGGR